MTFQLNYISDGPLKVAQNIILDKLEIVLIPNSNQALGYLTVIDTDSNGKPRTSSTAPSFAAPAGGLKPQVRSQS